MVEILKKHEVSTLYKITEKTFDLMKQDNNVWPGVPFHKFQWPGMETVPEYNPLLFGLLINSSDMIQDFLRPGAVVKFVSNIVIINTNGDKEVNNDYILVRLIYARSAIEHVIPETDEVVYPLIPTQMAGENEMAYIDEYVGIVKKKYFENFVMDPSHTFYDKLQEAHKQNKVNKELEEKIRAKPVYTLKNLKKFWWLPWGKESKYRGTETFNRDNLVTAFPDQGIVWDSNITWKVKIIQYASYFDRSSVCGENPDSSCPLALVARIDDKHQHGSAADWANADDESTWLPQKDVDEKVTPNARYGYVFRSLLKAAQGEGTYVTPSNPPTADLSLPSPASTGQQPPGAAIDKAESIGKDENKCKYYVKVKVTYQGTEEQLKNDKLLDTALRIYAFEELLRNYNKIAVYNPGAWATKDSGDTSYKPEEKKILNEAYVSCQVEEKKKVTSPNGKATVLISVSSGLFDKIPDRPSLTPWVSQSASDLRCRLFLKKEGVTFEEIITSEKDASTYITTRFSLEDVEQMAETYVNVFHRRYVSEYMEYINLVSIDFQMEADYLMKFVNGIKKLARDNNLDITNRPGKNSIIDVIFDKDYRVKNVIYSKEGPWNGELYQFKIGTPSFISSANNKSTNKLIYDLCSSSVVNDPATGHDNPTVVQSQAASKPTLGILGYFQVLHKTFSDPPSTILQAPPPGKNSSQQPPIIFNLNDFFKTVYPSPNPRVEIKPTISRRTYTPPDTEEAKFPTGPKSLAQRQREDKSITAVIKREGKNLKKTKGSIFPKETNKFVGDLVKSKSAFNMILHSETFFGPKGLYQQLLNKTNLHVWLKSVFECAGYDLKGDDLFEVLCNIVLKNLPWEKIKDEVLMNLNEATGEVTNWCNNALEDIYEEISSPMGAQDFDLDKAMQGLGDVLKYADPKWYPGFDKTTQLYNSLNMGKTPVGSGGSSPTFGGKSTSLSKCADMAPEEPKFPPGVKPNPNTPEIEIPYLAHESFKASHPGVYSSGTAVYKWKIFLNYKFSTADPAVLGDAAKYAFTEDDFKKFGTKFDKKTQLATEKYSYIFRSNWVPTDNDKLGTNNGIVSLAAFREATSWWATVSQEEIQKYESSVKQSYVDDSERFAVEKLKKLLNEIPAKFGIDTLSLLMANHNIVINQNITAKRIIDGSKVITTMVMLNVISKSASVNTPSSQNTILGELLMSPESHDASLNQQAESIVEKLKENLQAAFKDLGISDAVIDTDNITVTYESSDFDKLVSGINQETGETVKYHSFLSQPQVPTDFQSWKSNLNGYINAGAFSKEGQIRLVTNVVNNFNLNLATLVTSHCNPEFLCKHLEKYILDLMGFFETGDLSKLGLGKLSDFFKNFSITDLLGDIGKLWVAAILKQIDQSLLETFKWLARYIQLNCELMMSEAGQEVQEAINKLDDGIGKDFAKFGTGLFNLNTEPDPEEANNVIEMVFPYVAPPPEEATIDSYNFEGVDNFRIEEPRYDKVDVNKAQMLKEARKFVELLRPQEKESVEAALKEIQSFLYKVLLTLTSKKLVALFSGNGSLEQMEDLLLLIEDKYPSLNKILDSPMAVGSFFNFIGATVDLELFINTMVSRKIIQDSCELKDLSDDIKILSSKAILALEEQNRIRNEYIAKIADLAIDNGALGGPPKSIGIDYDLIGFPDNIPYLDYTMTTLRDGILDSVEMSYRSDIKNLRAIFLEFKVTLDDGDGNVFNGFSELAGSLNAKGESAAEIYDSYLNALSDHIGPGNNAGVNFGKDGKEYTLSMKIPSELYPQLQEALAGSLDGVPENVYKIAGVNGPNSPKEQRVDIFPSLDYNADEFQPLHETFIKSPDELQGNVQNANFAFVMAIDTDHNEKSINFITQWETINYKNYIVLDPFKNHATMASVISNAASGKYTTAAINNEHVMFSWKSGLYTSPADMFNTETTKTYTYGDPCSIEDLNIPHDILEETNFKKLPDDAFPEIKDPLLGNIAENFPLDVGDFNTNNKTLPQARMFSKYVMNILYKNLFEVRRGVYDSPPDNLIESIKKVRDILEIYVFPRVTNNLIRSLGEYVSHSKYFDTKEMYKLTQTLCDPTKIPFDLIGIGEIKEQISKRYVQHRKRLLKEEQQNENSEFEDPPGNGPFEFAMMEGTVKLILRTYLAELLIRSIFIYDRFVFEEVMDNDMFLELFAKQFLIGIENYIGEQDPKVFKNIFLRECKYLAKSTWDSVSPKKYPKQQVFNDNTVLIKHLTSIEIQDIGSKINSLFSLDAEKIKPLKEVFFDDLKYGFLRNSGINFGQDTTPTSYYMFNYSDSYNLTELDPISDMAQKSQMTIDQASKQGAAGLDDAVYFDADENEMDFQAFPYDKNKTTKLGFGEFVIEPYVRLVDWEVEEGINAEFPLTAFDKAFGPNGNLEEFGLPGYTRKDWARGVLGLRDLQKFAIDLMEHLNQSAEDAGDGGWGFLQQFGQHNFPLSAFYKELKWGIRLNLIIPADPEWDSDQIPFEKLEEAFNKLISSTAYENRWVPAIHKSYRVWRQNKEKLNNPDAAKGGEDPFVWVTKKIPYFVMPLTYEEMDADVNKPGSGAVLGFATDLVSRSFKELADLKAKNFNLELARYIKYPSDADVYRTKFNMGYRDPAYLKFEETVDIYDGGKVIGETAGSLVPVVIHSDRLMMPGIAGDVSDFEGITSVEDSLINYYGETYGLGANHVANYSWTDKDGDFHPAVGNDLFVLGNYSEKAYADPDGYGDSKRWTKAPNGNDSIHDTWNAHVGLLTTKYARNQFAQWMGIGVELDEQPFTRDNTEISSMHREQDRPDYNPAKHPGLVGRPDFNVKFIIDYESNIQEGTYPHGASDNAGCKKFTFKDYQKIFPSIDETAYLDYIYNFGIESTGVKVEYLDYDFENDGKKYENMPLTDTHFKNMAAYKMSRCKKSPSWKQIGASFPGGSEVSNLTEWSAVGQKQLIKPAGMTIYDIYPPNYYNWNQVATDNQETFLKYLISKFAQPADGGSLATLNKGVIQDQIKYCINEVVDEPINTQAEFESWKENNKVKLDQLFDCINNGFGTLNAVYETAYKMHPYKHPGGMPMSVINRSEDYNADMIAQHLSTGYLNTLYLHTGIFTNQVFSDYKKTSLYGDGESTDNVLQEFYGFNREESLNNPELDSVSSPAEYRPHSDNIDTRSHLKDSYWSMTTAGYSWSKYLRWSPGYNSLAGSNFKIPGIGPASSLEPSQIWVKHADSIDFRELVNKKTDYLLERVGFMPSFYSGYKVPLSITEGTQKEFPIFDAASSTYKDEDENDEGLQSKSSLVEILRSETDVVIKFLDQEWNDDLNIAKPGDGIIASKTPDDKKKYPRSKLDIWRVKIEHKTKNPFVPDFTITEEDILSGKVNVVTEEYIKGPSGKVSKDIVNRTLQVDEDMLMSRQGSMFRKQEGLPAKLEDETPLFLDDDNTWGGDTYVGLFPAQEDLGKFKKLIQALNVNHVTTTRKVMQEASQPEPTKDYVYVDTVAKTPLSEANEYTGLSVEILDLLFGGSSTASNSVINPLVINESSQFGKGNAGPFDGAGKTKWGAHAKQFLASISSAQDILKLSKLYYISAGLGQRDILGNWSQPKQQGDIFENYIGEYKDLPPSVKQYYVETVSNDEAINGKAAVELKIKMRKSNYATTNQPGLGFENVYLEEEDKAEDGIEFNIKLYQVRLRSANALKLGDIEYGSKMEIKELVQENDGSTFIKEFFVGDLIEKQQKEKAGDLTGVTSIYDYLKDKMINGPDGKGSPQFQLLFNYIFPLKQYASFITVYTLFYSLYRKGTAFDTNQKMQRLFTNTKVDLFDLFELLSSGGDPYKKFGLSNLEENVINTRQADAFKKYGSKGISAFQEKQNQILEQIRSEGLEPGFFAPFTQKDHSGLAHDNIRMLFEILANMIDPGFDTFPITPIGWVALAMRRSSRELEQGTELGPPTFDSLDPSQPITDTDLCKNE